MIGGPLDQTLTLEVDADPGDAVAERLLPGLPLGEYGSSEARINSTDELSRTCSRSGKFDLIVIWEGYGRVFLF
jgi:hypothetical protein